MMLLLFWCLVSQIRDLALPRGETRESDCAIERKFSEDVSGLPGMNWCGPHVLHVCNSAIAA
jgi:hypothetical protein